MSKMLQKIFGQIETKEQFDSLYSDCLELLKILTAITKTQKNS